MTNTFVVCLLAIFCTTNLSLARQVPKECAKGPEYWCQNLRRAADCGAVGHCVGTLWEKQQDEITTTEISDKFIRLFKQLKDIKDLINDEYLGQRVGSACRELSYPPAARVCKENTAQLDEYLGHVLKSDTSPETMCKIVGMCNNLKINDNSMKKKLVEPSKHKEPLLGAAQCTWGPSYWCSNFSTGRECKATTHCVERVWAKMEFAEDSDSICKICTDMVTQARDQLMSNETQEELKEVFEGSCKLMPIKIVRRECIKLADEFVPELVETLSSEMNPQAVCSVAGLCNNARIDQLLDGYNTQLQLRTECHNCQSTVKVLRKKFDGSSYEDFLVGLLQVCSKMDSLSDSCSMLVFKYYENILEAVRKDLQPKSVCHVSGQCAFQFHQHDDYIFPKSADIANLKDDVPCEFCEQLVKHFRDTMVANTTEMEFYRVVTGLCKQTGKFKSECLHLAEEYYPMIYKYLVSELNSTSICIMMGMCGGKVDTPIAPLLPQEIAVALITPAPAPKLLGGDEAKIYENRMNKQANVQIIGEEPILQALPIERMFVSMPQSKPVCSFCQYFLHYLQVELSDTKTEDAIKDAVEKACDRLPQSVNGECKQFVTEYGPMVIALLVQEIDPASVCPAVGLCAQTATVQRVAINSEKSNCPLCLFAVEQLETMLQNNHSEENIRTALDNLCNHLSTKLRTQCVDFVDTYSKQLIEMLVADMNAQEVCVYLKLCKDDTAANPMGITQAAVDKYHDQPHLRGDMNHYRKKAAAPKPILGDIETNEIPDDTVNGRPAQAVAPKSLCVICEFVLKEIDDEIKDKHNDDDIKNAVHSVCKRMPKSVRTECDQFVDKYADLVISLLAQELDPAEVCEKLKLCPPSTIQAVKEEILDCAVCETVVMAVKKVLSNDKVDRNIVHIVEKSCGLLPAKYNDRCHTLLEIYGDSVIHLIEEYGVKGVCQKIGLCSNNQTSFLRMYKNKH